MHRNQGRLRYLDGLRGIAISLVLIWHLFGPTYAAFLPDGAQYAGVGIVRYGWMGVYMFFLISGFVIFMTIERCTGFVDFMLRRWLRLFPAMLIASALLFALDATLRLPGPDAGAKPLDLLPGLTFVTPSVYHALLHTQIRSLDSVFWTLYVEAAFYIVFALLYFRFDWRIAIGGLVGLVLFQRLLNTLFSLLHAPPILLRVVAPLEWLGVQYFCWFASGAIFYRAYQGGDRRLFAIAVAVGLLAACLFESPFATTRDIRALLVAIVLLFAAVQVLPMLQRVLAARLLLFVGGISYPLYLTHSNLGVALTARLAMMFPAMQPLLATVSAIVLVIALAWLIARYAEPWLTARLRPSVNGLRHAADATAS